MSDDRPQDPNTPPPLPPEAQRPADVPPPPPIASPEPRPLPSAAAVSPGAPRPAAAAPEPEPAAQPYTPPPVYLPEPPREEPQLVDFPPAGGASRPAAGNAPQPGRGQRYEPGRQAEGRATDRRPVDRRSDQTERQPQKRGGIPIWFILAAMFALFVVGAELESIFPFLIGVGLFIYITTRNKNRNRRD